MIISKISRGRLSRRESDGVVNMVVIDMSWKSVGGLEVATQ